MKNTEVYSLHFYLVNYIIVFDILFSAKVPVFRSHASSLKSQARRYRQMLAPLNFQYSRIGDILLALNIQ